MKTVEEIQNGLAQCYGSQSYFKNALLKFQYTEGVHFLWNSCDCYWLLIAISSHNRKEPFQVWNLQKNGDNSALLTMKEDSGLPNIVEQKIPYTDFPLDQISLWLIDGVLILPSEY